MDEIKSTVKITLTIKQLKEILSEAIGKKVTSFSYLAGTQRDATEVTVSYEESIKINAKK